MPLPTFADFNSVWIEKTKASHGHGGKGWDFGSCLWSPTTSNDGKKIYRNMTLAKAGDLVLHFYEDTPFGRELDHYFCGVSVVDKPVTIRTDEPPLAGEWAGRSEYFRVALRDFSPIDDPIPVTEIIKNNHAEMLEVIRSDPDKCVVPYRDEVRLAQGKYLTACGPKMYSLLSAQLDGPVSPIAAGPRPSEESFDYEGYVEGQRSKREAYFFSRNPQLVRDAKKHYGLQCSACGFDFEDRYPGLGEGYIEVHHLNPLSEAARPGKTANLTKLSQVAVLCANCHRMIHRLIRKHKQAITVEELKRYLKLT